MKTIRLLGNSLVECVDAPIPEPGQGEVVIATHISALCGSELKTYRGTGMEKGNSGHEAAGWVAHVGKGVADLKEGQRVGVSAIAGCGHCPYCDKGQNTYCTDRRYYGSTHSEYFVTAARACHLLPDDLDWEVALLISGDGFGVPYHTSTKLRGNPIDTVAIFGMGPIGLGNTLMQTHLGRSVIAVDVLANRLDLAHTLGASNTVLATETQDVVGAIRDLTDGRGVDVCIEAAGRPETAKQCFKAVRTAGTVVFNGEQPAVELSPSEDFIRRDITAVGSWYTHFNQFAPMLDLYRSGLEIDRLVTHRFPLEQAGEAFRDMASGKTGKVIINVQADRA
jgi:threonine dehydrogenase-like Zn-dependent dehydrogenase